MSAGASPTPPDRRIILLAIPRGEGMASSAPRYSPHSYGWPRKYPRIGMRASASAVGRKKKIRHERQLRRTSQPATSKDVPERRISLRTMPSCALNGTFHGVEQCPPRRAARISPSARSLRQPQCDTYTTWTAPYRERSHHVPTMLISPGRTGLLCPWRRCEGGHAGMD
jgi:hypothetical protein